MDSSDFNSKHPRWPAGSPGGIGGEFAPKDEGSISTDEVRSALDSAVDKPSRLPAGVQVAENEPDIMGDMTITGSGVIPTPPANDPSNPPKNLLPAVAVGVAGIALAIATGGGAVPEEVMGETLLEGGTEEGGSVAAGEVGDATASADVAAQSTQNLQDLLMPNGQRLGQAGTSRDVRIMSGGVDEAQTFFDQLTQGGKVITDTSYEGMSVELPNGTKVFMRTASTNSPETAATIDFDNLPKSINIRKVKFNP